MVFVHTRAAVLRAFLRGHDGLVLLAIEPEQTLLVAELLHLRAPHHRLRQLALNLAAVAARRLVDTQRHSFVSTYDYRSFS